MKTIINSNIYLSDKVMINLGMDYDGVLNQLKVAGKKYHEMFSMSTKYKFLDAYEIEVFGLLANATIVFENGMLKAIDIKPNMKMYAEKNELLGRDWSELSKVEITKIISNDSLNSLKREFGEVTYPDEIEKNLRYIYILGNIALSAVLDKKSKEIYVITIESKDEFLARSNL